MEPAFYTDKDVARRLSMSPSWVRQQRFMKAHGLPNSFDLEPCHIGSGVRYVVAEVEAFITAATARQGIK
jgi:predicted DNA-binding transcriptional regulator AlpA